MQGIATTSAPADADTSTGTKVVPPTEATLAAATTTPSEAPVAIMRGTPSSTASEVSAGSGYQRAVDGSQVEALVSQVRGWGGGA